MQSYLKMVRRQRQWLRNQAAGSAPNPVDDLALDAEMAEYRRQMEADLQASVRLVEGMELEPILEEAVDHSCDRCERLRATA